MAYVALVLGGIPFIQAAKGNLDYIVYLLAVTVVFVTICWLKGEPVRWRWGGRDT